MLRLPRFRYHRPRTAGEAVRIAAELGPAAAFVAGGTDLWPNMKRRQQTPAEVIGLGAIDELRGITADPGGGVSIGAMTTLTEIEHDALLRAQHPALPAAVALISTPLLRNMGTIGGNLLLDTRCSYYDQTFEWRQSIDFCMKRDGALCWVAPSSRRCLAVQSSDTVPLLCAVGAEVTLRSAAGERRIALDELYRDDGIEPTRRAAGELLTRVHLRAAGDGRAAYHKLRRRGTFDFPVLGVGAWLRLEAGVVQDARLRLGGTASKALAAREAEEMLIGSTPTEELIAAAAQTVYKPTRAMDNTDHEAGWRKRMAPVLVTRALRDCVAGPPDA